MKCFNTTAICLPSKHYMVDLTSRVEQIKKLVDDGKYFTKISESGDSVMITINDKNNELVDMIIPCRKSDFWGVCWENDNYNLWIQSGDVGVVCYSLKGGDWVLNSDAVRPDYIVSKYDK